MINFRYHVVSIVAVFLALAIGIVMGTTVISESVVERLEADARDFRARNGELRQEADRLEQELSYYDRFGEAVVPGAIRDRLAGRPVVLIVEPDTPGALLERTLDALRTAGTSTPARVRLTDAWSLDDQAARDELTEIAGGGSGSPDDLLGRAAALLGRRLSAPAALGDADLLRRLDAAGFLELEDLPQGPVPALEAPVVYLSAGTAQSVPDHRTFTLPLLRALSAEHAAAVAVAEPLDAEGSLAEAVRGEAEIAREVATVDHGTTWPGELALVWALAAAASEPAAHYGVRRGATAVAPAIAGTGP